MHKQLLLNIVLYVPLNSLFAHDIGMLSCEEILATLERHAEELRLFGVTRLSLFGSFARNQPTSATSDLDFLVEFATGRGLFDDFVGLKQFLEELFEREVDLVKPHLLREELRGAIVRGVRYEAKI